MAFITSRGYAEVQILQVNLTLSDFGTFWNASVQILKKSKTEKDITHLHM